MFWNTIGCHRRSVLEKLAQTSLLSDCYLAGGTGLALQLGHRQSVDFDWFTATEFDPLLIQDTLDRLGDLEVTHVTTGTFHCMFDDVQISWLYFPRPLLRPLIGVERPRFSLASMEDTGVMKLVAVSQRGARKDFIDLFFIAQHGVSIKMLLELLPEKYPNSRINVYHFLKSLAYFEDAEKEPLPNMLLPVDWEDIKEFFRTTQKSLMRENLNY